LRSIAKHCDIGRESAQDNFHVAKHAPSRGERNLVVVPHWGVAIHRHGASCI